MTTEPQAVLPRGAGRHVYRCYDKAALDRQYSPSSCVRDLDVYLREYAYRSASARRLLGTYSELSYGSEPESRFGFFPARRRGAPLHVFVHGGFWQELSKDDSAFPALRLVPNGCAFAALGYGLAPRYGLDEIVAMVRRALLFMVENLGDLPGAPGSIHLSGHSAGAQLVAMALLDGWMPGDRRPADTFASAVLLSGVYDLEPVLNTYVNDALGLDLVAARRNSLVHQLPARLPPLVVARGANETDEFARQQHEFVELARLRGGRVDELVVPGRNHFDLLFDIGAPGTALGNAMLGLVRE